MVQVSTIVALSVLSLGVYAQSTCTPYSAPAGACPIAFDSCCSFLCAEAQVPFSVCQPTDGTGQFATCTPCSGAPAVSTTTTTSTSTGMSTSTLTGTGTATVDPGRSTSTTTLTSTTTECASTILPTGNYTSPLPIPVPTSGSGASVVGMGVAAVAGVFGLMLTL